MARKARARRRVSRVLSRPRSVLGGGDGHSYAASVAGRLMRPTRAAARRPARHPCGCLPLLLGLAPGGVFPAAAVAGGAVRSYRTISPLPSVRPSLSSPASGGGSGWGPEALGGMFSVALS